MCVARQEIHQFDPQVTKVETFWEVFLNSIYSCLPIKQAGSNKQAGWIISETLTNKQAVINKQGGILVSIQ